MASFRTSHSADPMGTAELARRLGVTADTFCRTRGRYHTVDLMPQPLSNGRPYRWDRATIEAWLGRNHPHAIKGGAIANDNSTAPLPAPSDAGAWSDYLAQVYR